MRNKVYRKPESLEMMIAKQDYRLSHCIEFHMELHMELHCFETTTLLVNWLRHVVIVDDFVTRITACIMFLSFPLFPFLSIPFQIESCSRLLQFLTWNRDLSSKKRSYGNILLWNAGAFARGLRRKEGRGKDWRMDTTWMKETCKEYRK